MARIWSLPAWPAPTTVFFTAFGAYSAIGSPSSAGTSMAMPRAWPSFSVAHAVAIDEGLLDGGFHGRQPRQHLLQAVEQLPEAHAEALRLVGDDRAAGDEAEPDPVRVDDAPAGAPQARVDADDANRFAPHSDVIAQGRAIGSRRSGVGSGSHGRKYGLRLVNALEGKRTEIAQLMLR